MERLSAYLPRDRYLSLASGRRIPSRVSGSVLFADISGFTPLTEELTRRLGPARGPEELARRVNRIYEELVQAVDRYHGSVLGFAGDAMACWFQGDDGRRAAAAALGMQRSMAAFAGAPSGGEDVLGLGIKIGVAVGLVRRFVVGDPAIQRMDVLAGRTLVHMAEAQSAAREHEVVFDEGAAGALDPVVEVSEWRQDVESGRRFAVVAGLRTEVPPDPWPPVDSSVAVPAVRLREWVLLPVYERLVANRGDFLTELRPAIALFISFSGIDYDTDPEAGAKLDAYVRWAQRTLHDSGGFLINITIGDKGSYLHACFGAPVSHENDLQRALTAALALRTPGAGLEYIHSVRIGISLGTMRCGSYGSDLRHTYGVQGDETNLAARLMQHAASGEVLVGGRIRKEAGTEFRFEELEPVRLKGKRDPVPVFRLLGPVQERRLRLSEPAYALPMIGRRRELGQLIECLDRAVGGRGCLVGVTAEAGMGKSRLLAEFIREVNGRGIAGFGGNCSTFGLSATYSVWRPVWTQFFGLDRDHPKEVQVRELGAALTRLDPEFRGRLPLLSDVIDLPIPDNGLTRTFDPKLRKSSREALLVDCLRRRARREPMVFILEDLHWIDPLSVDLLRAIAAAVDDLPVLVVLSFRPAVHAHDGQSALRTLPHYREIRLGEFTREECSALIRARLDRPAASGLPAPEPAINRLVQWSGGNPFYLEELLNYAQDQRGGLENLEFLESFEVPGTLQSLILSRIDQLSESQKGALKVASVVGRVFQASFLWGAYPELGSAIGVRTDLDVLQDMGLTDLEHEAPELVYFFKHALTQEVAYASLPSDIRALIHGRVGRFIEESSPDRIDSLVDLLAFHYLHGNDPAKRREYLLRAGDAAQARYANRAAIDYFRRVLPLLAGPERIEVQLRLGQVLERSGDWTEAGRVYHEAHEEAVRLSLRHPAARCGAAIGELLRKQTRYAEAAEWLDRARVEFVALGDRDGEAQTLHHGGTMAAQRGDTAQAHDLFMRSLEIRRSQNDLPRIASLLSNLGILAHQYTHEPVRARELYEESLAIRRQLNDRWAIGNSLNNLGVLRSNQGELEEARRLLEESVALNREVGDRWATSNSLTSLADIALQQQDFPMARRCLEESLQVSRELDEPRAIAFLLECFGRLAAATGRPGRTVMLFAAAGALRLRLEAPLSPSEIQQHETLLGEARAQLDGRELEGLETAGSQMTLDAAIALAMTD